MCYPRYYYKQQKIYVSYCGYQLAYTLASIKVQSEVLERGTHVHQVTVSLPILMLVILYSTLQITYFKQQDFKQLSDVYTRVPVWHTYMAYMYDVHVCKTCCNYVYTCVPVLRTSIAYMYAIPVLRTGTHV